MTPTQAVPCVALSLALAALALGSGCAAPQLGVPASVHPGPVSPAGPSVGASMGVGHARADGDSITYGPHTEAWLRTGGGPGQLEIRGGPGIGYLGYRWDARPFSSESGWGLSVLPLAAAGYFRASGDEDAGEESVDQLILAASLTPIFFFAAGGGALYLAPKAGYTYFRADDGDGTDSGDALTLGGTVGYDIEGTPGLSFELTVHRLEELDNDVSEPFWLIVPSVGFRM